MKNHHKERTAQLWRAILSLENEEECASFFGDLCTVAELEEMAKRLEVAKCIDGGMSYGDAAERTGASTATISRVKRSLYYGNDGYRAVIDRLKDGEENS
jgi:TrpR-related protein YerC/YecD